MRMQRTRLSEKKSITVTNAGQKIKTRLGWDMGSLDLWRPKPKGMHTRTFERLVAELDYWEQKSDLELSQYFLSRFGNVSLK
jgi:hypothetical protein